jgi:hypothetical protein
VIVRLTAASQIGVMPRSWIVSHLSWACLALPLAAQTALEPERSITGRLAPGDPRLRSGGRAYDLYSLSAAPGDTLTIELASDDFDASIIVNDRRGKRVALNDNAGEGCNARVTLTPARPARYRIFAAATASHGLGTYRLSISRGSPPAPADTTCRHFAGIAGVLRIGRPVRDSISDRDLQFRDSTRFRRYVLPLDSGAAVTLDLSSNTFDPYLIIERGRGELLMKNQGSRGCATRAVYHAPDHRPIMVVVNTAARGQRGAFVLRASAGAAAGKPPGACPRRDVAGRLESGAATAASGDPRTIAVGQAVLGAITVEDDLLPSDSTYAQAWMVEGRAGQTITIDLESTEFDPFLYLDGPGLERPLQDDDSAGNCNARLSTTLPATGTYTIVVNTAVRNATGRFTLSVSSGSKPPSLARCARVQ